MSIELKISITWAKALHGVAIPLYKHVYNTMCLCFSNLICTCILLEVAKADEIGTIATVSVKCVLFEISYFHIIFC